MKKLLIVLFLIFLLSNLSLADKVNFKTDIDTQTDFLTSYILFSSIVAITLINHGEDVPEFIKYTPIIIGFTIFTF